MKKTMMNIDEWERKVNSFLKNKKGMNFDCDISVNEGKLNLRNVTLDKKYENMQKKMQDLLVYILRNSVMIMVNAFDASYAYGTDDYQLESEKNHNYVAAHMEEYMRILANEGAEKFLDVVMSKSVMLKAGYMLEHLDYSPEHDNWKLPNGLIWNGGWIKPDGEKYYDAVSAMLSSLMPAAVTNDDKQQIANVA